jgi:hypothetical protein
MAMSDCIKCWDTPCRCGHDYKDWSEKALEDQIAMLQGVLAMKRLTAFREEADIDVVLQPNAQILAKYHDMVLTRENELMIHFDVAKIHDSGFIQAVTEHDGLSRIVLVDTGHAYVMPTPVFHKLEVSVGERVLIVLHHKQYRIAKSKYPIARPAKIKSIHSN